MRPISKTLLGDLATAGNQIRIMGILDGGAGVEELYVKRQMSNYKFLCVDTATETREGTIILQEEEPTEVGQGRLAVYPFGTVDAETATATAVMAVESATINAAGTGYTVSDVLTVVGGTAGIVAEITVDTVDGGGEITGVTVTTAGEYTALPTNPVAVTGGTGNDDATFDLTWLVDSITVTDGGASYDTAPTVTISGNGTGATATAILTGDAVSAVTVDNAGTGFTEVATVTIAAATSEVEYARVVQQHVVKTHTGNRYRYDMDVAASEAGEADLDKA